ncbi:MAG: PilZ domain-containing protein [Candidatus Omnitrophica bacterium]|nr:PilZ domain-containing protein [Candidatus Omnitrophota bacterium]
MADEKRSAVRVKKSLSIKYQYALNTENLWDISFVKDISEKGVCINTKVEFPVSGNILLSFKLPTDPFHVIEITGKVIDSRIFGQTSTYVTRIQFPDLSIEQRTAIQQFVAWAISSEKPKKS